MWKVGDKVSLKVDHTSFSMKCQTLIIEEVDTDKYVWCRRKGQLYESNYPFRKDEIEKLSINPFIRIKRMFCRAFECSYE